MPTDAQPGSVPLRRFGINPKELTANYTVPNGDMYGLIYCNTNAAANITVTLPAATPGKQIGFLTTNATKTITVAMGITTDAIRGFTAGSSLTLTTAQGSYSTLVCIIKGFWEWIQSSFAPYMFGPVTIDNRISVPTMSALTLLGTSGAYALYVQAGSTVGSSFGAHILGGTNSSDFALVVANQAASTNFLTVNGQGQITTIATVTTSGVYAFNMFAPTGAGASFGLAIQAGTNTTDYALNIANAAGTFNPLLVRGDGLVQTQGGAQPMIGSITAWNNGAGAGAGTLTNAPAAGNPTKWISINDAGTIRKIPAW